MANGEWRMANGEFGLVPLIRHSCFDIRHCFSGFAGGVGSVSKSIHFMARRNGSIRNITSPF